MEKYLVGIFSVPKYQSEDIIDLPFCATDCIELKKVFNNHLGIDDENINLVGNDIDQEVSKADILKNVIQLRRKAEPDDIIIFYFSGHGFSENNIGYLATSDTDLDIASDTSISITRIRDELNKSDAKIKILIIDSCYSGIGTGKKFDNKMSEEFENSLFSEISEGWVIFASCKRNEMSYSLETESMSVFSSFLIEGLKGNADTDNNSIISIEDLRIYVTKMVLKWSIENDKIQTPNMNMQLVGKLTFSIKNPDILDIDSHDLEIKGIENKIQSIVLTSVYTSDSVRYFDMDDWEEISNDERKTMVIENEKDFLANLFAIILDFYKPSQIISKEGGEYDLPFGKLLNKSDNFFKNEFELTINKDLSTPIIEDLLNSLDTQNIIKWQSIKYMTNGNFDFDNIHDIAKENGYSILEFLIKEEYSYIKIMRKNEYGFPSDWGILFENNLHQGTMKIFQVNGNLENEFFQMIPISELMNIFSPSFNI